MRKSLTIFFISIFIFGIASGNKASMAPYQRNVQVFDTIKKMRKDTLLHRLQILDSMFTVAKEEIHKKNLLIDSIYFLKDSIQEEYYQFKEQVKSDSVESVRVDSLYREKNYYIRSILSDSIDYIYEDSVRNYMDYLFNYVFHDSTRSAHVDSLQLGMDRLIHHLRNDSLKLWLRNLNQDSVSLVLKNGFADSTSFWLHNNKQDSAKIFLKSDGRNLLDMWASDNLKMIRAYKKVLDEDLISGETNPLQVFKAKARKIPKIPHGPWRTGGAVNTQFSQTQISNWASGGESSITLRTTINGYANWAKNNASWKNNFSFVYGILRSGERKSFRKNADDLRILSKFDQKAFKKYHYAIDLNFDSQSFKGYNYPNDSVPVSKFMAPAVLKVSLGLDYKPDKYMSFMFSPLSSKSTFVLDTANIDQTKFGLKADERIKKEMGANFSASFNRNIIKNVNLNTQLTLYSNYLHNPQNIDVEWRVVLSFKVNRYINTTLTAHLKYDDDALIPLYEYVDGVRTQVGTGKRIQFREVLGFGFVYNLYPSAI